LYRLFGVFWSFSKISFSR